jgi:hypothetical protein
MICLMIVKTATEAEALGATEDESGLLHGTKVLKELIEPWALLTAWFVPTLILPQLEQQKSSSKFEHGLLAL